MLKTVSYIILFIVGSTLIGFNEVESKESTVVLSTDSYVKIKGKTNVSTFECNFDITTISDGIRIKYNAYDERIKFNDTKLTLPNLEFNCGGNAINRDFNKLLNTEEYPEIILKLKEISKGESVKNSTSALIEITLSNKVRTYTVPIVVNNDEDLNVSGVLPLDINDFGLAAPTKMLGMVKVSPDIEIQFSLKILEC
ncbi:YceI family protein [Winogradskyella sp. F6397]|uniref:YceI family protein n=1 Tax=Winogradskyella marina TaxID=2785530 RepID=A0ABS0EMU5_9FLAO|nr:YceI family protein [Winogradskyella marina]MBF8150780.1 YceI family protein [Winogradskyella marina]